MFRKFFLLCAICFLSASCSTTGTTKDKAEYFFTIECSDQSGKYFFENTSGKELSPGEIYLAVHRAAKAKNLDPNNCKVENQWATEGSLI
jgi:hypothetical protein